MFFIYSVDVLNKSIVMPFRSFKHYYCMADDIVSCGLSAYFTLKHLLDKASIELQSVNIESNHCWRTVDI